MSGRVRHDWRLPALILVLGGLGFQAIAQDRAQVAPVAMRSEPTAKARLAMEGAFARADLNGDGRLTRAESVHLPAIEARFDELDVNHDGFLSLEEFIAGAMTLI